MARKSGQLRGFGVLAEWWHPEKVISETGTRTALGPGDSVAVTADARGAVKVLGAQSQDLEFRVSRAGGAPGIDEHAAGITYATPTEGSSQARHWLPPLRITGSRYLQGSDLNDHRRDAVVFPMSGKVLVSGAIDMGAVSRWDVYDPHTHTWDDATQPTPPTRPDTTELIREAALAVIPGTETVIAVSSTGFAVKSDDYGTTWDQYAWFESLDDSAGLWYLQRLRAAFDGAGNCMLTGEVSNSNGILLYYSTDFGGSWRQNPGGSLVAKQMDTAAHPNGTIVTAVITTADDLECYIFGGALQEAAAATNVVIDDGVSHDQVAIGVDEDGVIWVISHQTSDLAQYRVYYSTDGGASWSDPIIDAIMTNGSAADRMHHPKLLFANGAGMLITGTQGGDDWHSACHWLGGWEGPCFDHLWEDDSSAGSRNQPTRALHRRFYFDDRWSTQRVWNTATLPTNWSIPTTWTLTQVSGGTVALSWPDRPYMLRCYCPGGGDQAFFSDIATLGTDDHYWEAELAPKSTGTLTSLDMGVRMSGPNYDYSILLDSASYVVRDNHAGTTGTEVPFDNDSQDNIVSFRVYADGSGNLTVLHRAIRRGTDPYATSFTRTSHAGLTSTAGASQLEMRIGNGIDGIATQQADMRVGYFAMASAWSTATDATPPELCEGAEAGWGKTIGGTYPYPIPDAYDASAERVCRAKLTGGPYISGEQYDVEAVSKFAFANIFAGVSPSPDQLAKTADTGLWSLEVRPSHPDTLDIWETAPHGEFSRAIVIRNCNIPQVVIKGSNVSGTSTLLTIDMRDGFAGLSYLSGAAESRVIWPATTGAQAPRYLQAGELRGSRIIFDPSGSPLGVRIVHNTAGWWGPITAGDARRARIVLERAPPATSGTMDVVFASAVAISHEAAGGANVYSEWTIEAAASQTVPSGEGYQAGEIGVYAIHVPGKQWGHGWEESLKPNIRVVETPYGTEYRSQRGPTAREFALTWDHGARDDAIDGQTTGDWWGTASHPLVQDQDVYSQLSGLLDMADGGARPALLLFDIPDTDGAVITDPRLWCAGYIDGGVRVQEAAGRDGRGVDSFYRAGPITFKERV